VAPAAVATDIPGAAAARVIAARPVVSVVVLAARPTPDRHHESSEKKFAYMRHTRSGLQERTTLVAVFFLRHGGTLPRSANFRARYCNRTLYSKHLGRERDYE